MNRPLSPFMFPTWYRFQITSALSILHRLTGIALAVGSILLTWWLIAVAAGFAIEFFIAPPDPAVVSMWAEYRRSGWTDSHAFGLANTLDSGFTHLFVAPIVAMVFGGIGSLLARFLRPAVRSASSRSE